MSHEIIGKFESRTMADGLRMMLEIEGIPSLVERTGDSDGNMPQWCVKVPKQARQEADRILAERRQTSGEADWEHMDLGEPSAEVAAVLKARPATSAFTTGLRWVGAVVGFLVLGAAILGLFMALIG
jgi:hypothetical protein